MMKRVRVLSNCLHKIIWMERDLGPHSREVREAMWRKEETIRDICQTVRNNGLTR